MRIEYAVQPSPDGLAQAFIIGEPSSTVAERADPRRQPVFRERLQGCCRAAGAQVRGATVFAYPRRIPKRFGVVAFDEQGGRLDRGEAEGIRRAAMRSRVSTSTTATSSRSQSRLEPSARGELEITDREPTYISSAALGRQMMARGMAWLDTGTHDSLMEAAHFIQTLEKRQGLKVGCPEEIAWRMGGSTTAAESPRAAAKSGYGHYLLESAGAPALKVTETDCQAC